MLKLLQIDVLPCGTIRLQSQLYVGGDSADYIIKDGVLKCYGRGNEGFDFYESNTPYEIVFSKDEMKTQEL